MESGGTPMVVSFRFRTRSQIRQQTPNNYNPKPTSYHRDKKFRSKLKKNLEKSTEYKKKKKKQIENRLYKAKKQSDRMNDFQLQEEQRANQARWQRDSRKRKKQLKELNQTKEADRKKEAEKVRDQADSTNSTPSAKRKRVNYTKPANPTPESVRKAAERIRKKLPPTPNKWSKTVFYS